MVFAHLEAFEFLDFQSSAFDFPASIVMTSAVSDLEDFHHLQLASSVCYLVPPGRMGDFREGGPRFWKRMPRKECLR